MCRMENLREVKREAIGEQRVMQRAGIQDQNREIEGLIDINTEHDMVKAAKMLSKKSAVTADLLVAIKNGLLKDPRNIAAFFTVETALPALLRIFCVSSDATKQLVAVHCMCNLALGDEKYCVRLAKIIGSHLVLRMEGMCPLIDEASVWTAGNLSYFREAAKILRIQGVYKQATKLLSAASENTKSAAVYCLTHALQSSHTIFTEEEILDFARALLKEPREDSLFCLSLTSHSSLAGEYLVQNKIHLEALHRIEVLVDTKTSNVGVLHGLVRILGNLTTESSGQVAKELLCLPGLQKVARAILAMNHPLQKEMSWFLANLVNHASQEIRMLSEEIFDWFPPLEKDEIDPF